MRLSKLPILFALSTLAACGTSEEPTDAGQGGGTEADAGVELAAGEAHVQCGCTIEGVGTCGEYIDVDGSMIALEFPAGMEMGSMPFCGQDGLVAKVEGAVEDGTYVATSFELKGE